MHGLYKLLLFHALACLRQNIFGSGIIRGQKPAKTSMRYMASVQNNHQHLCGGFLIDKDVVITTAKCDVKTDQAQVVLGTHNLKDVMKKNKFIKHKCIHPDNGIMILKLGGTNKNNQNKEQIIPLPQLGSKIKDNEKCHVAGWGCTKAGGKSVQELREMNVFIDMKACKNESLTNVICASGRGTGLCKGDYGGPLVCKEKAVGVAFFNNQDGPDLYVDISEYLSWIAKVKVKKNGC